jgi:hypothetical protein
MGLVVASLLLAVSAVLSAEVQLQEREVPLQNWSAPPYWKPEAASSKGKGPSSVHVSASLPTSPMPFEAISPHRSVYRPIGTCKC